MGYIKYNDIDNNILYPKARGVYILAMDAGSNKDKSVVTITVKHDDCFKVLDCGVGDNKIEALDDLQGKVLKRDTFPNLYNMIKMAKTSKSTIFTILEEK